MRGSKLKPVTEGSCCFSSCKTVYQDDQTSTNTKIGKIKRHTCRNNNRRSRHIAMFEQALKSKLQQKNQGTRNYSKGKLASRKTKVTLKFRKKKIHRTSREQNLRMEEK